MKKFLIGLLIGLFVLVGINNASFFDTIMNSITRKKAVNFSNQNVIVKTMLFEQTGYNASGTITTGNAKACINCAGNNYFDGVTSIGTTLGTTTFTNGFQQSLGSGLAWNDVQNLSINLGSIVAQQPVLSIITGGSIRTYCFDGGSQMNEMYGQMELPHDAWTGTVLSPHVHWYGTTTSATTTGIRYLDYQWLKNGVVNGDTGTIVVISQSFYGITGNQYKISEINGDFSTSGYNLGDSVAFRIYRTPTGTDTYAGNLCLVQVGFHYQRDSRGSRTEYVK